jgi:hypothetical protein
MTALRTKVVEATAKQVRIVFVGRETAKWWNHRRGPDDTVQFCGWYWVHGMEEAGPFRSRSSCIRDAYYKFVLQRDMPQVGHALAYPSHNVHHIKRRA